MKVIIIYKDKKLMFAIFEIMLPYFEFFNKELEFILISLVSSFCKIFFFR